MSFDGAVDSGELGSQLSMTRGLDRVQPVGYSVCINRVFNPYDKRIDVPDFDLEASLLDVPEGQPKPVGSVSSAEALLKFSLFPGEDIFDELWTRNVNGGSMPFDFCFSLKSPVGDPSGTLNWDPTATLSLPVFLVGFSM
jgi:hypothetical protein